MQMPLVHTDASMLLLSLMGESRVVDVPSICSSLQQLYRAVYRYTRGTRPISRAS